VKLSLGAKTDCGWLWSVCMCRWSRGLPGAGWGGRELCVRAHGLHHQDLSTPLPQTTLRQPPRHHHMQPTAGCWAVPGVLARSERYVWSELSSYWCNCSLQIPQTAAEPNVVDTSVDHTIWNYSLSKTYYLVSGLTK